MRYVPFLETLQLLQPATLVHMHALLLHAVFRLSPSISLFAPYSTAEAGLAHRSVHLTLQLPSQMLVLLSEAALNGTTMAHYSRPGSLLVTFFCRAKEGGVHSERDQPRHAYRK